MSCLAGSDQMPGVSIIIPIRNEAAFIARNLEAVLAQDYPAEKLEVIVADGMSTDGTRKILEMLQARQPRLYLIDNPGEIVSTGLNAAVSAASGEIIIRLDGHSLIAADFVRESVAVLREHPEAWSAGGPILHAGETTFGKAVAVAMSHWLGVGNASHRFPDFEGYAEGAAFPAIWRWVFERIGNFDEQLVRNQDDEFNYRISRAGGRVYVSPRIRYTYFVRERVSRLFKQYYQYGFWRIPVIRKHRRPTTWRQLVPPLSYLASIVLLLMGVLLRQPIIALALPFSYALALIIAGIMLLPKTGVRIACRVPIAMAIMHLGYACGIVHGLWAGLFQPDAWDYHGRMATISR